MNQSVTIESVAGHVQVNSRIPGHAPIILAAKGAQHVFEKQEHMKPYVDVVQALQGAGLLKTVVAAQAKAPEVKVAPKVEEVVVAPVEAKVEEVAPEVKASSKKKVSKA